MKWLKASAALAATVPMMLSGGAMAAADTAADAIDLREWARPRLYLATRFGFEDANANQFRFEHGYAGILAAGMTIGHRWRVEFAIARRGTPIRGIPPIEAEGSFRTWSHMLNGYWHMRRHDKVVSPYIGAGVGYNISRLEAISTETDPVLQGLGYLPQRHTKLGVQGIFGLTVKATKRLNVDLQGVYFTTGDEDYDSTFPNNPTVEAAYRTFSGQIGVRLKF